jgi:DNA-binding winged helix-turn-helix (wHTH) protein
MAAVTSTATPPSVVCALCGKANGVLLRYRIILHVWGLKGTHAHAKCVTQRIDKVTR